MLKKRIKSLDLLRGIALLIMIEAHVFNAVLDPSYKDDSWFRLLDFINGIIAPAFLFVTGFLFVHSAKHSKEDFKNLGKKFWLKFGRIILIILAGYSLHLPVLSLSYLINDASQQQLNQFYIVDILQCIGAGLLLLLLLRSVIKKDKVYYSVIFLFFLFVIAATPYLWNISFSNKSLLFFTNYLQPNNGSYFPFFPWGGYILAGALFSYLYNYYSANDQVMTLKKVSFIWGVIFAAAGHILFSGIFPFDYGITRANPIFFMQRFGYVLIFFTVLWFYTLHSKRNFSFLTLISKQSLLIYWLHLELLYRKFFNEKSITDIARKKLDPFEAMIIILIIILLSAYAAYEWQMIKIHHRIGSKIYTAAVVMVLVLIFLFRF